MGVMDTLKRGATALGKDLGAAGKKLGKSLAEGGKRVDERGGPQLPGDMDSGMNREPTMPGFGMDQSESEPVDPFVASPDQDGDDNQPYVPETLFDR